MSRKLFKLERFKGLEEVWDGRQTTLKNRKAYYTGKVYQGVVDIPLLGPRLAKSIKPLFLPLARAVDVDAGIIPRDWALHEDATDAQEAAQDLLFSWSEWDTEGVLYVHYGAQYGLSGLKVSDLQEEKRVELAPLDPTTFLLITSGAYGREPSLGIIIEEKVDEDGRYEYAEVYTPEQIETYRDGVLWGFDGREPVYPNTQGRVPIVEVQHIKTGDPLGEATFQKAIPMLDEVNELATMLAKIIKDHAEAQWAVIGAEPTDLWKSGDNVWFIPDGSDVKAIVASIDIGGVLSFIESMKQEVRDSLPELSFDELKRKDQIATATLELQLGELVIKIHRSRPNYDAGMIKAFKYAGEAASKMGISELASLAEDGLLLDPDRPVIPLDKMTLIQLELQEIALEDERERRDQGEGDGESE